MNIKNLGDIKDYVALHQNSYILDENGDSQRAPGSVFRQGSFTPYFEIIYFSKTSFLVLHPVSLILIKMVSRLFIMSPFNCYKFHFIDCFKVLIMDSILTFSLLFAVCMRHVW